MGHRRCPVLDTELLEVGLPQFEFGAIGAPEGDVIESDAVLVETVTDGGVGELMQSEQRPADQPHHVPERSGVLVDHGIATEQTLVPRDTLVEIADRERSVMNTVSARLGPNGSERRRDRRRSIDGGAATSPHTRRATAQRSPT